MPNFLIGSAYAVSAGLVIYAISSNLAPAEWKFPLVMIWAIAGLALAFLAVLLVRRGGKAGQDSP